MGKPRRTLHNAGMSSLSQHRIRVVERFLPTIDRLMGRVGLAQEAAAAHLLLGDRGEEAAYFHLRKRGRIVVARRWRSPKQPGDLDLVTWDGEVLCFVEVKTRGSHDIATAESAVDADKRRMIRRMARLYIRTLKDQPRLVRFDIVSVYYTDGKDPVIRVIPAAFGWSEPAHRWS
jgi:putative endonuclease